MKNKIIEQIATECSKLNPLGIAMAIELNFNTIMDLLSELSEDKKYKTLADTTIIHLGFTINKEMGALQQAELRMNRKNASNRLKTIYYNKASDLVAKIKADIEPILNLA